MAEDINALLDQCEQRAQVLSQETDRAWEEVNQIVQLVTTLASTPSAASLEASASFEAQLSTANWKQPSKPFSRSLMGAWLQLARL